MPIQSSDFVETANEGLIGATCAWGPHRGHLSGKRCGGPWVEEERPKYVYIIRIKGRFELFFQYTHDVRSSIGYHQFLLTTIFFFFKIYFIYLKIELQGWWQANPQLCGTAIQYGY